MRVREGDSEINPVDMGLRGSPERRHPRERREGRPREERERRGGELYNYCEMHMTATRAERACLRHDI